MVSKTCSSFVVHWLLLISATLLVIKISSILRANHTTKFLPSDITVSTFISSLVKISTGYVRQHCTPIDAHSKIEPCGSWIQSALVTRKRDIAVKSWDWYASACISGFVRHSVVLTGGTVNRVRRLPFLSASRLDLSRVVQCRKIKKI